MIIKKNLEKWILAVPPTLYLLALFFLPISLMIFIAFREPGDYGGVLDVIVKDARGNNHLNLTFDWFLFVLHNKFIWKLFLRSIVFAVITTVICLFIGYPLALLIARSKQKYRELLLLLIIIPFWSNFLIRIYAWMILLGPGSVINSFAMVITRTLGLPNIDLLYSTFAVILCLVYINLPFMILPLYANLEKHDYQLIEASRDLGANAIESFFKVTIPLSLPGIFAGCALVFIPCLGMFVIPELVGNNCSMMIGNLIKEQFLQTMHWPLGSVTSILMTMGVLAIVLVTMFVIRFAGKVKYVAK
jgi:spermidine/putrescine transport system permease protein